MNDQQFITASMAAILTRNDGAQELNRLQEEYNKAAVELDQFNKWFVKSPSEMLAKGISDKEEQKKTLHKSIEAERMKVAEEKTAVGSLSLYEQRRNEIYADGGNTRENRIRHRELIRELLDKIVVNQKHKECDFYFKGEENPVKVKLFKECCEIRDKIYQFEKGRAVTTAPYDGTIFRDENPNTNLRWNIDLLTA